MPTEFTDACVWCDEKWPVGTRTTCRRCGRADWSVEPDYSELGVAEWMEYEIVKENSDFHRVVWLDLVGVGLTGVNARPPLTHRLKNTYKGQMNDLRADDARGLHIVFARINGPQGKWEISVTRPPRPPHNPFLTYPPGLSYPPP